MSNKIIRAHSSQTLFTVFTNILLSLVMCLGWHYVTLFLCHKRTPCVSLKVSSRTPSAGLASALRFDVSTYNLSRAPYFVNLDLLLLPSWVLLSRTPINITSAVGAAYVRIYQQTHGDTSRSPALHALITCVCLSGCQSRSWNMRLHMAHVTVNIWFFKYVSHYC